MAALLAVGLTAVGCCRSPFEAPRESERDLPWYTRLTRSLRCATDVQREGKTTVDAPLPGAMPIAQPIVPEPTVEAMAPGQMRAVSADDVPCTNPPHHGRTRTHVDGDHDHHRDAPRMRDVSATHRTAATND